MQTNPFLLVGKALLTMMWVFGAGSFFLPSDATIVQVLRLVFLGTLAVHFVECLGLYRTIKATGRPLLPEFAQIMLFGVLHLASIQQDAAEDSPE